MSSRYTVPEKASALLGILLFCFQLGGAYLLPAGAVSSSCFHTLVWLSSSPPADDSTAATNDDSVITTPAPPDNDGDSVWQCPGTANGIAVTPPQPYRVAAASGAWSPESVWINTSDQRLFLPEGDSPGHFQPPRSRIRAPF